jgi:hypothetical protein
VSTKEFTMTMSLGDVIICVLLVVLILVVNGNI